MAICKYCAKPFSWGIKDDGRFVPLIPVGEDDGMDRTFQDENGALRAEHWFICISRGGPTVRVAKLAKKIAADEVLPNRGVTLVDPETGEILSA